MHWNSFSIGLITKRGAVIPKLTEKYAAKYAEKKHMKACNLLVDKGAGESPL
jgi:hypothetical protein